MIATTPPKLIVRQLALQPYLKVLDAMHRFTDQRNPATIDEIWLVQHPKVFTQGQAGKPEHLLSPGEITVVQSDRGGQVTYHAPGQQIVYILVDLKRKKLGIRALISALENSVIATLSKFNLHAQARPDAPGVYIENKKICSLGLRIRRGCSFHGLALNVKMDMEPFSRINPCGYQGMQMIQLSNFVPEIKMEQLSSLLIEHIFHLLDYSAIEFHPWSFHDDE